LYPFEFLQAGEHIMAGKIKMGEVCLVLLALLLGTATTVAAQGAGTGTIQGRVADQTGAVVPGAKVTVRNTGTNVTRVIQTDEQGEYRVTLLQPGKYEVTAEATGMAKTVRPEIQLEVGSTATVNFELKVAAGESTITVTDTAPVTEPERTEVTNVVGQKAVEELPINGRRWDNFVLLTPSVSPDGTFGLISSRGISGLLNNNTVDGADNNQAFFSEARGRTRTAYTISQSSIKEFQVGLSTFSAEFGRAAGGTINAVTKSGSNEWHGEGFYYIRDDSMQAREPTLRDFAGNALKNADRRQQYGLGLGGPIVRDKVFFYGNYDGQHRQETYVTGVTGTFFNTFLTDCNTVGGGIPTPPAANCSALLQFFQQQAGQTPRKRINNVALGKIDWNVTPNHILTGSYNWHRWRSPNGIQTGQRISRGPTDNGFDGVKTDSFIARLSSVINARMVNEAKFQFGRDFENQLGNSTEPRTTISNGISFGMSEFLPRAAWPDEKRFQWTDTLSWTTGRHTWKFGLDINYVRDLTINLFQGGGVFNYFDVSSGGVSFDAVAGLALDCPSGAIALGCVQVADGARTGKHWSTFQQAFDLRGGNGDLFISTTDYNFFAQDTFKLNPRVTINTGLRYEYQALPKVKPVTIGGNTFLGFPGQSFTPETQKINADTNNFGPRLAVAWDVNGDSKDVVRFGAGIYYGRTPNAIVRSHLLENGVALASFSLSFNAAGPATNPVYGTLLTTPPTTTSTRSINFMADDYVRAFITMMDIAYERELTRDVSVSFTYLYTRGNHLSRAADINLNPPTATADILFDADGSTSTTNDRTRLANIPFFTGSRPLCDTLVNPQSPTCATRLRVVARQQSDLNSTYQGGIIQLTQRSRWGLTQTAHITFSSARDDGQAMGSSPFASGFDRLFNPFNKAAEYARSDFDVRKRFVWYFIWEPSRVWKADSAVVNRVLGNWSFNSIITASDGQPFQPQVSGSISSATGATDTGSINGSNASLRTGWQVRNPYETPGFFVWDFRVQKDIYVSESMRVRFLWEAFNLLNRTNTPNRFNFSNTAYRVLTSSAGTGGVRQVVLRQDSAFAGIIDPITGRGQIDNCTLTTCLTSASGVFFGARDMQLGVKFIF
jgi:hypothetical protein